MNIKTERQFFERAFPVPAGVVWNGEAYQATTRSSDLPTQTHRKLEAYSQTLRWKGWIARAERV